MASSLTDDGAMESCVCVCVCVCGAEHAYRRVVFSQPIILFFWWCGMYIIIITYMYSIYMYIYVYMYM